MCWFVFDSSGPSYLALSSGLLFFSLFYYANIEMAVVFLSAFALSGLDSVFSFFLTFFSVVQLFLVSPAFNFAARL